MNWFTVITISLTFSTIYTYFSISYWLPPVYLVFVGIVLGHWKADIQELDSRNKCKKCNIEMVPGQALENTLYGIPDFIGDDTVCTMSMTGPPIMISVWKCPKCGYSTT